jgi:NTP pyrophosphatase (non-canonical NTP hydrolase)
MNPNKFIEFVESLENNDLDLSNTRVLHAVLGIAGESGELVDLVKKSVVYHQPLKTGLVKEELGDLLHYIAMLISASGWTFEEVMEGNSVKLKKRYPNGYSNEAAVARADKVDRTAPTPGGY